jgi:TPR repeat protein
MNSRPHRSIASSLIRALPLCLGLIIAPISPASSDQAATLAEEITHDYNSTQIAALIAAAAGKVETGTDRHSPSLEPLQHTLDVSNGVAAALLRILDRTDVTQDRLANDLAESAIQYHAVLAGLAEIKVGDPAESPMLERARAAMTDGRFNDAEAELRQIEDRKAAAFGGSTGASTALESADEHRLVAAQTRTLLGAIALMRQDYSQAVQDFLLASQRLSLAPSDQPDVIQPQPVRAPAPADAAEPPQHQLTLTYVAKQIDGHEAAEPRPPDASPPAIAHDVAAVAPERVIVDLAQPTAMKPAASTDRPKPAPAPIPEALAKPPPSVATLPDDILELLLRRGDSMLALGDLTSARLLYARAASAGDARGATGVAKTYDPRVVSQIGTLGIKADPAAAAIWYQKALDLGDGSATTALRLLGQAR